VKKFNTTYKEIGEQSLTGLASVSFSIFSPACEVCGLPTSSSPLLGDFCFKEGLCLYLMGLL